VKSIRYFYPEQYHLDSNTATIASTGGIIPFFDLASLRCSEIACKFSKKCSNVTVQVYANSSDKVRNQALSFHLKDLALNRFQITYTAVAAKDY